MIEFYIINAIAKERARQKEKWGEQNHDDFIWLSILTEEVGELAQAALHDRFGGKAAGTLETELVQAATVAIQWIECLRRNANSPQNTLSESIGDGNKL